MRSNASRSQNYPKIAKIVKTNFVKIIWIFNKTLLVANLDFDGHIVQELCFEKFGDCTINDLVVDEEDEVWVCNSDKKVFKICLS